MSDKPDCPLADLVDAEADFYEDQGLSPDYEHAQKLRAAAAALRAGAEREAWLSAEKQRAWEEANAADTLRDEARRKVAKYIGKARVWRESARAWTKAYQGASGRRDEALALGRELAKALVEAVDEPWKGESYRRCTDAVARAREAGWLVDGSAPSA